MLDFTNCKINNLKSFGGANGEKLSLIYNDEQYMIKFPPKPNKNKDMSYTNSCVSEYISCHIFNELGVEAQETLLGTYQNKVVVACKDLSINGYTILDFASLKNQIIDSSSSGYGTELSSIIESIEKQKIFDVEELKNRFWDMFIIDAFVGNFDRHNGNWGYLYNDQIKDAKFCPIFDCGSTLYPQADEETYNKCLTDEEQVKHRIYNYPTSVLKINDIKISYFEFITSCQNKDCNEALKRIFPRINMININKIIDDTPYIGDLQKSFYKKMLNARYEIILSKGYNNVLSYEDS